MDETSDESLTTENTLMNCHKLSASDLLTPAAVVVEAHPRGAGRAGVGAATDTPALAYGQQQVSDESILRSDDQEDSLLNIDVRSR